MQRLVMFNWKAVGWCVGTITSVNTDGRKKVKVGDTPMASNFKIHYEHDDSDALHCLRLEEQGQGEFGRWVLLEAEPAVVEPATEE